MKPTRFDNTKDTNNYTCGYCETKKATTIDHVVPLVRGGSDNVDNLVPACRPCNSSKYNKTSDEWMVA